MLEKLEYFVDGKLEKPKYLINLESKYLYEGKYNFSTFIRSISTLNPRKILKQLKNGKYFITNNWKYDKNSSLLEKSSKVKKLMFKADNFSLLLIYNND